MSGTFEDVNGTFAGEIRRDWRPVLVFALPIAAVIFLWLLGDFTVNRELPMLASLGYWTALAALVCLLSAIAGSALMQQARRRRRLYFSMALFANTLVIAMAMIGLKHFFGLDIGPGHGLIRTLGLAIVPATVALGLAVYLNRAVPSRETAIPGTARLSRMPHGVRGEIIALQADDHYVHVHTAFGKGMIKYRFADAVAELGANGLQVHKSWWVNSAAIAGIKREKRNLFVELEDGTRVPVSRSRARQVQSLQT